MITPKPELIDSISRLTEDECKMLLDPDLIRQYIREKADDLTDEQLIAFTDWMKVLSRRKPEEVISNG